MGPAGQDLLEIYPYTFVTTEIVYKLQGIRRKVKYELTVVVESVILFLESWCQVFRPFRSDSNGDFRLVTGAHDAHHIDVVRTENNGITGVVVFTTHKVLRRVLCFIK